MAVNPNEDTEFNDALRKHGILPPKPEAPRTPSPPPPPTLEEDLDDLTLAELQELADDVQNDETERAILEYRTKRMAELAAEESKAIFGRVYPIGRDDYTREVTEASKQDRVDGEEKGTGVVCYLYKDGIPRSDRTTDHIRQLASRYPRTKFVSIVGDKCIPDLPDSRIPMLLIYRRGEIINQIVAWGADRDRRLEELEVVLIMCGAVVPSAVKQPGQSGSKDESEDEDDWSDGPAQRRSGSTLTNGPRSKNIRGKNKNEDSDSDFDI